MTITPVNLADDISGAQKPINLSDLSPAQLSAFEQLEHTLAVSPLVALAGASGSGRSTVLALFAQKHGGKLACLGDILQRTAGEHATVSDMVLGNYLIELLDQTDLLVIDDLRHLQFGTGAARPGYIGTIVFKYLYQTVQQSGKRMLISGPMPDQFSAPSDIFGHEMAMVAIAGFEVVDYQVITQNIAGAEKIREIDFSVVYRFASMLNGHQLRMASALIAQEALPTTDSIIVDLQRHGITAANVRTQQVEALSLDSLPGHEHIISRLETNIILPLENRELAQRLGLKPKRGVLLYGPPGTGKTSIGRALAHRMQGKFFMIDGSFVSEPPGVFFRKLAKVVEEAKANSPSVLFIDDADVLFRIEHIAGLARYLLTLLDGLESQTANNVCVMMTAMDVRHVPDALLRSGRVELWLETTLPHHQARMGILQRWMTDDLPHHESIDYDALASLTEGFTPADLRRVVADAKALYAADRVKDRTLSDGTQYIARAVSTLIKVRERMADGLRDDSVRIQSQPKASDYGRGTGGMAAAGSCGTESGW